MVIPAGMAAAVEVFHNANLSTLDSLHHRPAIQVEQAVVPMIVIPQVKVPAGVAVVLSMAAR